MKVLKLEHKKKIEIVMDFFEKEILPDLKNKTFTFMKFEGHIIPSNSFGYGYNIEIERKKIEGKIDYALYIEQDFLMLYIYYPKVQSIVLPIDTSIFFEKVKSFVIKYLIKGDDNVRNMD